MGLWMIFILFHMLFCMCLYIFPFFYFYKSKVCICFDFKKNQTWIPDSYHKLFWLATNFFRFLQEPLSPISPEAGLSGAPLFWPCEAGSQQGAPKGVVGGLSSSRDHLAPKPHSAAGKSETQAKESWFLRLEVVKMSLQPQRGSAVSTLKQLCNP